MRPDFAVFILTHRRADRVYTYDTLRKCGYTGPIFIVIDDADDQGDEYRARFGDAVLTFSKEAIAQTFDEGDNFRDRRAIVYARNACFDLARSLGVRYFMQLDDDYTGFFYKFNSRKQYQDISIKSFDRVLELLLRFYTQTHFASVAMAQGGDHLGGSQGGYAKKIFALRKAMNTFICDAERPFQFVGRVNEDVNTYTGAQRAGLLFLTILSLMIIQKQTQSNSGGMTELYLSSGTYIKSFYSVMYAPSAVRVGVMQSRNPRLHHTINWDAAAPKIVREALRKSSANRAKADAA